MHNGITRSARAALLALALATAGCGGGGGSGGTPPGTTSPDTTAPDTTITSNPAALSNSKTAIFNAASSETGSTFEASLDSAAFASATLPLEVSNLPDGKHTISIRARDAAGNIDGSPATFTWTVDTSAPSANIVFPLPNSYTDATTLTIRGTTVESNGIASVHVNDVAATSSDGFKTWSAIVPIHAGQNEIVVSTIDELGNTNTEAASASVLNRGPVVGSFAGIAFDASSNQIVAGDWSSSSLYIFDPVTGSGKTLASRNATSLASVSAVTIDTANHRALVVDTSRDALVSVDLTSGATHDLSTSDSSHYITSATSIILDASHDRVFIGSLNTITQIDLTSGSRTTTSGGFYGIGNGPILNNSPMLALDTFTNPGTPRLVGSVIFDLTAGSASIISVDIATGDREVISPTEPSSASLVRPTSVAIDSSTHRLLVLDSGTKALVSVDLATGNRTVVSDQSKAPGSSFAPSIGLAVTSGTAFVAQEYGEVLSVDLSTGAQQAIVHSRVGQGPRFGSLSGAAMEQPGAAAPQSLLVLEGGRLTRVSLSTGDRTVISSSTVGSGPFTTGFTAMALDTRASSGNASALAIVAVSSELVSIDLTTGDRTHVADLGFAGASYLQRDMRLDAEANRVYFSNIDLSGTPNPGLYSYDLGTNQRTTLADNDVGTGPFPRNPLNLLLDKQGNRIIVSDWIDGGLISVDLRTGARLKFAEDPSNTFRAGPLYLDAGHSRILGVGVGGMNTEYRTSGPLAQEALAALNAGGWSVDDSDLFTMVTMIEHPGSFVDKNGTTWMGGAANYDDSDAQQVAFATQYPPPDYQDYASRHLFSLAMADGTDHEIVSGLVRGSGPPDMFAVGIDVDPVAGIAYVPQINAYAVMALDLISGDRVLISR
jgi:hypothetical protein